MVLGVWAFSGRELLEGVIGPVRSMMIWLLIIATKNPETILTMALLSALLTVAHIWMLVTEAARARTLFEQTWPSPSRLLLREMK